MARWLRDSMKIVVVLPGLNYMCIVSSTKLLGITAAPPTPPPRPPISMSIVGRRPSALCAEGLTNAIWWGQGLPRKPLAAWGCWRSP